MPSDPVQRRLAAILAAAVARYSRPMGVDEEGTLATLTGHLVLQNLSIDVLSRKRADAVATLRQYDGINDRIGG